MPDRVNGSKNNFPVKILSPQIYILFMLNASFYFMNSIKFLNLTTVPTSNSQNHIAMKIPYVSLCLHLDFLFNNDPQDTLHSLLTATIMVIYDLPTQCPSLFLISQAHVPVHRAVLTASMSYF